MIVERKTLIEVLGLTGGRIDQLVKEGLPKASRGKFDLAAAVQWYIAFKMDSGQGRSSDVNDARKQLYEAQVVKTQLETARIRREMIPADEFMIDMNQLGVMFSAGLDSISGRLAAELAGMSDPVEISDRLAHETNEIRQSVADAITSYSHTISNS